MNKLKLTINEDKKSAIAEKLEAFKAKSAEQKTVKEKAKTSKDQSDQQNDIQKKDAKKKLLMHPKEYSKVFKYLNEKYPKCFKTEPEPLKIKIHRDLWKNDLDKLSKPIIRKFLTIYCRKYDYRKNMILDSDRIGLDGNAVSTITEKEIEYMSRNKKHKAKDMDNADNLDNVENKN